MAMDETVRIRMQIEGEEKVQQLRADLEAARAKVAEFYAEMGKGDAFNVAAAPHLEKMRDAIKSLGDEQESLRKLGTGFGGLNNQIFQTGRVLQDLFAGSTYGGLRGGLVAIANNVEQLAQSFGLATKTVVGLSVGMTALPILLPAIEAGFGKLLDLFRDKAPEVFATRIEELSARLKELSDKPVKIGFDLREMDVVKGQIRELEAARESMAKALGAQSKAEAESGRRVGAAIAETPEAQDVLRQIGAQAEEAARRGEGPQGVGVAARQAEIGRIRARMAELDKAIGAGGEGTEALVDEWTALNERLGQQVERLATDQVKAAQAARDEVGKIIHQAESGREQEQREAQDRLARLFAATGTRAGRAMAEAIWNASATKVAQEKVQEEAKKVADEKEREIQSQSQGLARDLVRGVLGLDFLKNVEITPERIRAELAKTLPAGAAADLAGPVLKAFLEMMVDQVAAQARQGGVDLEQARRQMAEQRAEATPEARRGAGDVARTIRDADAAQRAVAAQYGHLQPDIVSSLRKGEAQGLSPAEVQQRVAEAVSASLVGQGIAPDVAEGAAFRMVMSAAGALPRAEAQERAGRAARVGRAEAKGFEALTPTIEQELLRGRSAEAVARDVTALMQRGGAGPEAAKASHDLVAHAAEQLNATYNRFFAATGNKDRAIYLSMQELARSQAMAAVNARAMAAGFESIRQQQRAVQQQLRAVGKSFQLPGRR